MRWRQGALVLACACVTVLAHGGDEAEKDWGSSYAEQHMGSEHHLDSFDMESFFHLHDLNRDGILDTNELESIYGVHHDKVKKSNGMSVEVHTEQARKIVQTVLDKLDTNGDGVLTMREFLAGGIAGLPHFQGIENLGHHYDAEGEYFLHHEEKYHNTPETSREEDYIHPEDIEHFLAHEKIEKEEEERMAEFVGDDPVALGQEDEPTLAGDAAIRAAVDDDASAKIWDDETLQQFEKLLAESPKKAADYIAQRKQQVFGIDRDAAATAASSTTSEADSTNDEEKKRKERAEFARAQAAKFSKTSREARQRGEWGSQGDMKRPKDDADRLRRAVPYKYRMKKSWFGEF